MARIRFFGAAGEVTGSCTLVETSRARVLVDCGLFQGGPHAEAKNRRVPPVRPGEIDAVVLTHAHIDHSGRLPMLSREGLDCPIVTTSASIELAEILLRDSAKLQGEDADRINRRRSRAGRSSARPLYGEADVERTLRLFERIDYHEPREIAPGVTIVMHDAGHILGSTSIEMTIEEDGVKKIIAFSGDIGPKGAPLLRDPEIVPRADLVVLESTYGDREHRSLDDSLEELAQICRDARTPQGRVIIPSFAVGRTQQLVYFFGVLRRDGRLDDPKVFVDSPMATATTDLYRRHRELFDDECWAIINAGDSCLNFPGLTFTRSHEESLSLNRIGNGAIIISASGMCTGGRVLHHLKHSLWKEDAHVVIVGFQAKGTLGRKLVDGETKVRVMGEPVLVRAKVHTLGGFSAHAGRSGLLAWAEGVKGTGSAKGIGAKGTGSNGSGQSASGKPPRFVLNHGEDVPREKLAEGIRARTGAEVVMPEWGESVEV
ncbi:MAG: MBL fold metallo-hydrolase [Phycisphaerales bacterium]|jgi:metallo-beta-lactamase family protein|nr:MBL fold metallo-hydrolase [Phycisphaerales bacterium]